MDQNQSIDSVSGMITITMIITRIKIRRGRRRRVEVGGEGEIGSSVEKNGYIKLIK